MLCCAAAVLGEVIGQHDERLAFDGGAEMGVQEPQQGSSSTAAPQRAWCFPADSYARTTFRVSKVPPIPTCVVFPEPVSPTMMTIWCSATACSSCSR